MANRFEHVLPELVLQEQHVSDALRCVLHTILFARAAGPVKPRDAHCPSLGIDYACAGSDITWSDEESVANVDGAVDASIRELRRRMSPSGQGDSWRGAIAVQFYEARVTQRAFGLFKSTDKLVWEQWVVPVLMTRSLNSSGGGSGGRHTLRGGALGGHGGGGGGGGGGGPEGAAAQAAQAAAQRQHLASQTERAVATTANAVRECLLWVLDAARQIEHVPPVNYSFQLGEADARGGGGGGGGGGQAGSGGGRHGGERPEALATRVLQTPGMFDK